MTLSTSLSIRNIIKNMLMPRENLMISPMPMPPMIRKLKAKWEMVMMRLLAIMDLAFPVTTLDSKVLMLKREQDNIMPTITRDTVTRSPTVTQLMIEKLNKLEMEKMISLMTMVSDLPLTGIIHQELL